MVFVAGSVKHFFPLNMTYIPYLSQTPRGRVTGNCITIYNIIKLVFLKGSWYYYVILYIITVCITFKSTSFY